MICPRCAADQPASAECVYCGVVVAKYAARQAPQASNAETQPQAQRSEALPAPLPVSEAQRPAEPPAEPRRIGPVQSPCPWLSPSQRQVLFADLERLLRAHVPLPEALALAGAAVGPAVALSSRQLGLSLQQGAVLHDELRRYPSMFDPVERALLATAVQAGDLPAMCARLAARQQHAAQAGDRLRAGLTYPLFVLVSSAVLTPLPLAFSQSVAAFLGAAGLNLALLGATIWAVLALVRRLQRGDSLWLMWAAAAQVPVLRQLVFARRFALFLDVLALTMQAGLPLPQALPLAGAATGEPQGVQLAASVAQRLAQMPLSQALAGAPGLPQRLVGALTSAERSGFLADACAELAAESQQQYLRFLATLVAVLRTLALTGVALWVAWSVIHQFTGLISDPLGAMPGPEGEELRSELQRAMPSLRP